MIYAVYVPDRAGKPVTLMEHESECIPTIGYVCNQSLYTSQYYSTDTITDELIGKGCYIGSGTVYYYTDRYEAINKYHEERKRKIRVCREQIRACERCIKEMEANG